METRKEMANAQFQKRSTRSYECKKNQSNDLEK